MEKTFYWKQNESGKLVSEDGYITVYQRHGVWTIKDRLDGDAVERSTKKECMDEAYKRMLITQLGGFNVFLSAMEKSQDLKFTHQIVEE